MIKQEFLDLMEAQSYDIGGILRELLQTPTYKSFFEQDRIGMASGDFNALGEEGRSSKVLEFIEKYENSLLLIGPLHFIEYLMNHGSDNVLKLMIEEKVIVDNNNPDAVTVFKGLFDSFKKSFFNECGIPFVTNLTSIVMADKAHTPIQGRERELKEIRRQFGKLMKNNVVLTGEGGVGKTAIVEEFAMQEKNNYVIYELNVLGLVGCKKSGGSPEQVLEFILESLSALHGKKVLFVDEFHILVREGLADTLKRITSRSAEIKFIVSTTSNEFKKFIEVDKALERRFHPIPVNEIEGDILKSVLQAWCGKLKVNFGIDYDESIIDFVIEKMRVERQKTSPDKEKDILDASFSGCKLDGLISVNKDIVADVMASRLSIPKEQLMSTMFDIVGSLENKLKATIKGQDNAIKNVVKVIESSQMIKKKNKPMAVMYFAGPTSTGKTEMARQLALNLFGSEKNLIQVNCTDFKESHTISSLLGAPPGYVGSQDGGSLINSIKQRPFSVILFDEFEKAHRDLQDVMLPMFEEGIVTDRLGRVVDVTNCIIILTSNLGAENEKASGSPAPFKTMGFESVKTEEEYEKNQDEITERYKSYLMSLKKSLKPELISRINEIVVFAKLNDAVLKDIACSKLDDAVLLYKSDFNIDMNYGQDIIDFIVKKAGKNTRKIATSVEKYIQSAITKAYIKKQIEGGDSIRVFLTNNVVALEVFNETK